ncbi:hypothetical protein F4703DRAFT_1840704 [Phycomyces blakesleeanus]
MPCFIALYCDILCCVVLCFAVLKTPVLYCIVLYYTVVYLVLISYMYMYIYLFIYVFFGVFFVGFMVIDSDSNSDKPENDVLKLSKRSEPIIPLKTLRQHKFVVLIKK